MEILLGTNREFFLHFIGYLPKELTQIEIGKERLQPELFP
jgi:hypothetical protein